MNYTILHGDAEATLRTLPDKLVHCIVTSPPYWGLRDYGMEEQIGLEETPEEYVARLVSLFRECRRVLRDDGVLWLNLGDSYNSAASGQNGMNGTLDGGMPDTSAGRRALLSTLKPKDLVGIPWRVAFALQADGWYLRQDIIWHKTAPMPESVTDRCTKAHEYVFLLTKSPRYYYDAQAIAEPATAGYNSSTFTNGKTAAAVSHLSAVGKGQRNEDASTRNRRSVWTLGPQPYDGAHFATMPPKLAELCILAGCPVGGTVLDPFCGSGTTLSVAIANGRKGIGIELNAEYIELAHKRITGTQPALLGV